MPRVTGVERMLVLSAWQRWAHGDIGGVWRVAGAERVVWVGRCPVPTMRGRRWAMLDIGRVTWRSPSRLDARRAVGVVLDVT
jgi:hypothetical protein